MRLKILRIKNKILRILTFVIPYNKYYRPKGIIGIDQKSKSIQIKTIYSNIVNKLEFDLEFYHSMLAKTYDNVELTERSVIFRSKPINYYVAHLRKGRLYTDNLDVSAIIEENNNLVSEVSFQYVIKSTDPENSPIFKQKFFKQPQIITENAFAMLSGGLAGRGNYFHWIVDVLPRLHLLKESDEFDKIEKFIVPQFKQEFQKSSLALFGINSNNIIECNNFTHILCDNLYVSSHPRGPKSITIPSWVFDFYDEVKEKFNSEVKYPDYVYITRKDSNLRTIVDEDKLINFLSKHGFVAMTLSEYKFSEKINIFKQAKIIISAHGAGLTNLFFSNPQTRVLELFSEGYVDPFLLQIATLKNLDYHYLIFNNPKATYDDQKGQRENVIIDYNKLGNKLEELLKNL